MKNCYESNRKRINGNSSLHTFKLIREKRKTAIVQRPRCLMCRALKFVDIKIVLEWRIDTSWVDCVLFNHCLTTLIHLCRNPLRLFCKEKREWHFHFQSKSFSPSPETGQNRTSVRGELSRLTTFEVKSQIVSARRAKRSLYIKRTPRESFS